MPATRVLAHDHDGIAEAAAILRRGGLVALPTETVYGLAGRALDEEHVRRIFAAKGRPSDNPVIVHVAQPDDAAPLWAPAAGAIDPRAFLARFAPGPLTVVARRSALVSDAVTAGLGKVGVRVPAHPAFIAVLEALGEPLAAPSANASSRPSPTSAADVLASLDGRIDAVLDGGPCRYGIESTVVDVTGAAPVVLRPGAVSLAEIRAFYPEATALLGDAATSAAAAAAASPGLRHKHYAPAGKRVALVDDVAPHWPTAAALMVRASTAARLGPRAAPTEILADDAAGYARAFYAALYRIERAGAVDVVIEDVPKDDPAWDAVRDRITRASS